MSSEDTTLDSLIEGRTANYRFLARMFREEIDEATLDTLCAMRFPKNTGNRYLDEGYRLLCGYLSTRWERTLTELSVDYTRTFIGHGINAYSAAYPFESVHTSARRLLMQGARAEVLQIFSDNGIGLSRNWRESEDHIALELEFEEIMARRSLEALNRGDEDRAAELLLTQYDFLCNHLANWVPMLVAAIQEFSHTNFYKSIGLITLGTLETDVEFLEDILEDELDSRAKSAPVAETAVA